MKRYAVLGVIASVALVAVVLYFVVAVGHHERGDTPGPPSGRLAFAAGGSIYAINADGSGLSLVVAGKRNRDPDAPMWASAPAFARDGSHIAFVKDFDIWVVDSDGKDEHRLADVADWKPHQEHRTGLSGRAASPGRRTARSFCSASRESAVRAWATSRR